MLGSAHGSSLVRAVRRQESQNFRRLIINGLNMVTFYDFIFRTCHSRFICKKHLNFKRDVDRISVSPSVCFVSEATARLVCSGAML
jgi:hypothetical protein